LEYIDFWALNGVGFEVHRAEAFGIVGRNGAGKSTLLKVVARVLYPTIGRIFVCGKVAPLLELGAGFHPELSGRENIFLYGTLLGYTHQEMDRCFDEIVAFAELSNFIDAPLRTYSTGMVARLGFSRYSFPAQMHRSNRGFSSKRNDCPVCIPLHEED
jgi:ABC-2 type transport system ATP-binding protein/lipopolysaccharide transport system ATP-binding protein